MIFRTVVIGVFVAVVAGYMIIDGARQLAGIGYFAPGGRLGPWALLLQRIGLDPRSTAVAALFVAYGAALIAAFSLSLTGSAAADMALVVVALAGIWYVPFGTIGSLTITGLTLWSLLDRA